MTAADVLEVLGALQAWGVAAWIDGGWGVDALLGRQTRSHRDLDLVVGLDAVPVILDGFTRRDWRLETDERPTRLVLVDDHARQVDLHPVTFDANGDGEQALPDGRSYRYGAKGFGPFGSIGGHAVGCLSPEAQAECHLGYPPDEYDRRDMALLAGDSASADQLATSNPMEGAGLGLVREEIPVGGRGRAAKTSANRSGASGWSGVPAVGGPGRCGGVGGG